MPPGIVPHRLQENIERVRLGGACWVIRSTSLLTMEKKSGTPMVQRGDRFIITVFD